MPDRKVNKRPVSGPQLTSSPHFDPPSVDHDSASLSSQSDANSDDSDSSTETQEARVPGGTTGRGKLRHQKSAGWEIVEGLRDAASASQFGGEHARPHRLDCYLRKRRKWPMKGWHKRFFVLERGLLSYAKSPNQIKRGRYHGQVDLGLSVVSYKEKRGRIDIDADTIVHHIKIKDSDNFFRWLTALTQHRLYRQWELTAGGVVPLATDTNDLNPSLSSKEDSPVQDRVVLGNVANQQKRSPSQDMLKSKTLQRSQQQSGGVGQGSNRILAWLVDSSQDKKMQKDFTAVQSKLFDLTSNLDKMKSGSSSQLLGRPNSMPQSTSNPNLVNTMVNTARLGDNLTPARDGQQRHSASSVSTTNLMALTVTSEDQAVLAKQGEEFLNVASEVLDHLRCIARSVQIEKDHLRQLVEVSGSNSLPGTAAGGLSNGYVQSLKSSLEQTLRQNADMKTRLARIRGETDAALGPTTTGSRFGTLSRAATLMSPSIQELSQTIPRLSNSLSRDSMEFFDAAESLGSIGSSSEETDEEDIDSDNEEVSQDDEVTTKDESVPVIEAKTGRRERLPAPQPDTSDFSLMNLLCRNIGRDLSRVRLPVILNEPLGALQRLCEELEYSELIDIACNIDDPLERTVYVAAFAVSSYASTFFRSGTKPFNPVIGETYEYVREDKGWSFLSEQVSHHPPVAVCHCQSEKWTMWQEVRLKNKFWGKSIEAIPVGTVNLKMPKWNEHYTWNKVTTCIHNLFGSQRYVDHYGELTVTGKQATCRLTFHKANTWTGRRYEVSGNVSTTDGRKRQVFGKWNEGFYFGEQSTAKCVWRPGVMPEDSERYYGFTRFAIELNDLDPALRDLLPITDTRFRPDQRLLEEGRVQEAESEKIRVEEAQRKRIQHIGGEENWKPAWFRRVKINGEHHYEFTGSYWKMRKEPGAFKKMTIPALW